MNKERLLNVARALRESPAPKDFKMTRHVNRCGTPACAFGHYAAREDLQDKFCINTKEDPYRYATDGVYLKYGSENVPISYDSCTVADHFDLCSEEIEQLFSGVGCGQAESAVEAAEYIERFVAGAE